MSSIKLSAETIEKFKKLYVINQGLRIIKGDKTLRSMNETKSVAAFVSIEEDFPRDFGVYDLREFIAVVGVVENPEIDLSDDKQAIIRSTDGNQELRYRDAAPNLISSYFDKDIKIPSADVEVKVTHDQFKRVKEAADTLKLEYIGFKGDGTNILLSAFDAKAGQNNDSNDFKMVVGKTDAVFNLFYKASNLQTIDKDAVFTLSAKGASEVVCGDMRYIITLEKKSTYEG